MAVIHLEVPQNSLEKSATHNSNVSYGCLNTSTIFDIWIRVYLADSVRISGCARWKHNHAKVITKYWEELLARITTQTLSSSTSKNCLQVTGNSDVYIYHSPTTQPRAYICNQQIE
jgi:hypothetical protein